MPLSFNAAFDTRFGYYRARFWDRDAGFDTERKVPPAFWREIGFPAPERPSEKADKLAYRWAAREAQKIERELRRKPEKSKLSLAETWGLYKAENPDSVKPATILRSDIHARNVAAFLEEIGQPALTPDEFDIAIATRYRNWRAKQDVSPRTILDELSWAKQVCTFAVAWQSVTRCESVRLVRLPYLEQPENDGIALTEEQFGTVLERTRRIRDREILIQGVTTRLRKTNLLGMRAEWFDREKVWMRVGRELLKGGRRKVRQDLSAPVARWTMDTLGERTSGLLWPNERTGKPLGWWEHVLDELTGDGVPEFTMHDLRTTGTSWLDAAGVDKMTQAHLLGHSQAADVTDIYRKKFEAELRAAVDVYDQIRRRNRW